MFRFILFLMGVIVTSTIHATTFTLVDPTERVIGYNFVVFSHDEDTLLDIARRFDIGYREIVNANPTIDPWLPGANQRVLVPNQFILPDTAQQGIVINLAEMRLYYYPKPKKGQHQQVITHPIGIGREGWATPLGKTRIIQKKKDPTWTPPASILAEHLAKGDPLPKVVPAGPDNPLGAYAMRLAMPGYLLHGTNRPFGVGMRVSHGCIRLFPEDIEHLFGIVAVNTEVEIVYQPYKAAMHQGQLYLEAHEIQQEQEQAQENNMAAMISVIAEVQQQSLTDEDWPFIEIMVREQKGNVITLHQQGDGIIDDVWFVHGGLTQAAKLELVQAATTLAINEQFWPLQNGGDGEVVIGLFDSRQQAEKIMQNINHIGNMSAWLMLLSSDGL